MYDPSIETMPREQLEQLQLALLRQQVNRCYTESGFYRERLDKAGVKPGDIRTLSDLENIPPVTKEELRQEQLEHAPFGRFAIAARQDWRELHPSTGTTGVPVGTVWTDADVEDITEWTARTLWTMGVRPGDTIQNAFSYGLWVAGLAVHYGARRIRCFTIPIGAAMTERQMDYFQNPGSTVLLSTPSYALYLAERMRQRGIAPDSIALRLGGFGGEAGVEVSATRKKIEAGLGIEALDYYGLAEIGPTCASECSLKQGIHFVEDHILVEVVDRDTKKRCAAGEMGVLVLTHLRRQGTPMLRYWTNDYARLEFSACGCGRTHVRAVGGILGRADDLIIYKGENFYPVQVEKVVRSLPELSDEYRIVISSHETTGADIVTVVAECVHEPPATADLHRRIKRELREELGVTPELELVEFGALGRTEFKAKRVWDTRNRND